MKSMYRLPILFILSLSFAALNAQIKNAKSFHFTIEGNCLPCKQIIEQVSDIKNFATIKWNEVTHLTTITYNSKKTNPSVILKKLALAGFDNNEFLAPDAAFEKLPICCKYERKNKRNPKEQIETASPNSEIESSEVEIINEQNDNIISLRDTLVKAVMDSMLQKEKDKSTDSIQIIAQNKKSTTVPEKQSTTNKPRTNKPAQKSQPSNQPNKSTVLTPVFDNYFLLKDILVKSDGAKAMTQAAELAKSIGSVDMLKLTNETHVVWMKVMKELKSDSELLSKTKNIDKQRNYFMTLSKNMYLLIKVANFDSPVYYQHCPMANGGEGADWLSKELAIRNPYYGVQMMTCGNTKELSNKP